MCAPERRRTATVGEQAPAHVRPGGLGEATACTVLYRRYLQYLVGGGWVLVLSPGRLSPNACGLGASGTVL